MRTYLAAIPLALCLACLPLPDACCAERARLVAGLSAGPLLGLDRALRGGAFDAELGASWPPFETSLRAGAAYDASLGQVLVDLDLVLALGGGLRAVVGGLIPLGPLVLGADSDPLALEAGSWPDRFGLEATLVELGIGRSGLRAAIEASIAYEDLRLADAALAAARLSGARAFASCVTAGLALRAAWKGP